MPDVKYLYFSEEHSHATEQKLVKNDMDTALGTIDRILFVEDEVTTGRTILNIIEILKKQYPKHIKYCVASILNGMDKTALDTYKDCGIELFWLVKTEHVAYTQIAASYKGNGVYVDCRDNAAAIHATEQVKPKMICAKKQMNARRIVSAALYQQYCEFLYQDLTSQIDLKHAQKILVLGTEEFMYPALYTASKLEMQGKNVWFHATTRSPIAVSEERDYPFHTRYELISFYDDKRKTYVYDLQTYDMVVVMTDAQGETTAGICSLMQALRSCGNEHIIFVFS